MNLKTSVLRGMVLLSAVATLGFSGAVYAASGDDINLAAVAKRLPEKVFNDVSQIPEKPHFLSGYERKTDPWESLLQSRRFYSTSGLLSDEGTPLVDKSQEGYQPPEGSTAIFEDMLIAGEEVRIAYSHHHVNQDGMFTFWSYKEGELNLAELSPRYEWVRSTYAPQLTFSQWQDVKRVMGWAEFQATHMFVKDMVREGLEHVLYITNEKMQLPKSIIQRQAELLGDLNYENRLDEPVAGLPGFTVREKMLVPRVRPKDFLPDLFIISPLAFSGGFTNAWATPESESVIALSMSGLAAQYMSYFSLTAHELVHSNRHLQGTPMDNYFDVELWATLTTDMEGGVRWFLFHPYVGVVRDLVKTYWGYDAQNVAENIFPPAFAVSDVRKEEFLRHHEKVNEIKAELQKFIRDPKDGLMVQFYSDPYYWTAVNKKYCDTAMPFRLLMELKYEKATIFDPKKKDESGNTIPAVQQTKRWLQSETDAGNIKDLAEKSMDFTGEPSKFAEDLDEGKMFGGQFSKCPVHSRFFLMNEEERTRAKQIVNRLVERAKEGNQKAALLLRKIFRGSGPLQALDFPTY